MRAKVKENYRWNSVRACAGAEFVKNEYRPVPAGLEPEAQNCAALEIEPEPPAEMVQPHVRRGRKDGK